MSFNKLSEAISNLGIKGLCENMISIERYRESWIELDESQGILESFRNKASSLRD
jgi:hypothetical protein